MKKYIKCIVDGILLFLILTGLSYIVKFDSDLKFYGYASIVYMIFNIFYVFIFKEKDK